MEVIFEQLVKNGKNTVENLMKWFTDAKIIDAATTNRAKELLTNVSQDEKVAAEGLQQTITTLASEQGTNKEDLIGKLVSSGGQDIAGKAASAAQGMLGIK